LKTIGVCPYDRLNIYDIIRKFKIKSPPSTNLFLTDIDKILYISYLNTNSPILLSCKKILETFFVYLVFCSTFAREMKKE